MPFDVFRYKTLKSILQLQFEETLVQLILQQLLYSPKGASKLVTIGVGGILLQFLIHQSWTFCGADPKVIPGIIPYLFINSWQVVLSFWQFLIHQSWTFCGADPKVIPGIIPYLFINSWQVVLSLPQFLIHQSWTFCGADPKVIPGNIS